MRELAVRLGAEYRFLLAPATLESVTSRDALVAEPSITDALDDAKSADIAFIGIGTPTHGSSSAILESLNLDQDDSDEFWAKEPAGDVAARYYTAQGAPIHGVVDDRVLGISLEDLLEIPNVVGVASGRAKAPGVLGALRGRIIDSLVCDEALARSVLSAAGSGTTEGTHP